jgi:membrane protein DedA with SNARE-associated domain
MVIEELIREYGLWAVFLGVMVEGDLTLLFAGALAHYGLFSFVEAMVIGTLGGFIGDSISYYIGLFGRERIKSSQFYRHARPRLERLSARFGLFSIFLVKYVYGLRTASAILWGFAQMGYRRFAPLTLGSCFAWSLVLMSGGFFFSGALHILIGEVRRVGILLLIAFTVACIVALLLYLVERYVIGRQVPEMEPPPLQETLQDTIYDTLLVDNRSRGEDGE